MQSPSRARARRPWASVVAALAVLGALGSSGACSSDAERVVARPTPHSGAGGSGGGDDDLIDAGTSGPPSPDAAGNCGNQVHGIAIRDAPNVLFVLDASGSMATPDGPGGTTRYTAVRDAAVDLVRKLGTLVNVGAAVFPISGDCGTGQMVMAPRAGTPPNADGSDGETTAEFAQATNHAPAGGTPTAATLTALAPTVSSLAGAGKTIVLLATDGGPNCDLAATCDAAHCIANLENQCAPAGVNCCQKGGANGPVMCLDDGPAIAAVDALQKAGVTVYVIGIATGAVYEAVLDAMAAKGGAPLPGKHAYYQVDDLGAQLAETLGGIAGQFVTCDFELDKAPVEPDKTNVWLDQTLLDFDPVDGWFWKVKYSTISLAGKACAAVKTGQVHQVQIVEGCPTQVSK